MRLLHDVTLYELLVKIPTLSGLTTKSENTSSLRSLQVNAVLPSPLMNSMWAALKGNSQMSNTTKLSILFVFIWSTAFIAFKYCAPYAEPATFTVVRVSLVATVLLLILTFTQSEWPRQWSAVFHSAVVGVLIHGVYVAGSFASINRGLDVGLCALILSLQPLLTALLSFVFLGEKITARKLLGIGAGTAGVALLVLQNQPDELLTGFQSQNINQARNSVDAIALCVLALIAFTVASIYQKRLCGSTPVVSGAFIQFLAATLFMLPIAIAFETMHIEWNLQFVFGLGWLVLVLSLGAMFLLMHLIKAKDAGSVANLFFMVTPLVAILSWLLFNETLTVMSIAGMLLCTAGIAIANYTGPKTETKRPATAFLKTNPALKGTRIKQNA